MLSRSNSSLGRRARQRHPLAKWGLGLFAGLIILLALAVGGFRVATNLVPRYHDKIEQLIAARLGAPVFLGRISLRWHGGGLQFRAENFRVLDRRNNQDVISAKRVALDFGLLSLFRGTGARPSAIHLAAPVIVVRQRRTGWYIPGLSLSQGRGGGRGLGALLGLALRVSEGTLRVELRGSDSSTWSFTPVNIQVGGGRWHTVRVLLGLPTVLGGGRVRLAGRIETPSAKLSTWRWRGHLTLDHLRLAAFSRFTAGNYPLRGGLLRMESNFSGTGIKPDRARGRVFLDNLALGQGRLKSLTTRFDIQVTDGWNLILSDLRLRGSDWVWRPGVVRFERAAGGRLQGAVGHIALAVLPRLAGLLPPRARRWSRRLRAMQPTGAIDAFEFAMIPGQTGPNLAARLENVGFQAAMGAPGVAGLDAAIAIREGAGAVQLAGPLTLRMPHLFGHDLPLDKVQGKIGIAIEPSGLRLDINALHIQGAAGLDGVLKGMIDIRPGGAVRLALDARVKGLGVAAARRRYLPVGLLAKPLAHWLLNDLEGGELTAATLHVAGDVRRFPFKRGGGVFAISFGFRGVGLRPGKKWPELKALSGRVRFHNASLMATITGGNVSGARIVAGTARMPDLFRPRLEVDADLSGRATDFLAFLLQSPVGSRVKPFDRKLTGWARTRLRLELPILHPARFRLRGSLTLAGVDASYPGFPLGLKNLNGTVNYSQNGPVGGLLNGRLLGGAISLRFTPEAAGKIIKVTARGRFPMTGFPGELRRNLSPYVSGVLPLTARIWIPLGAGFRAFRIDVGSTLEGLAVHLPSPVGKPATRAMPLKATLVPGAGGYRFELHYGKVASACTDFSVTESMTFHLGSAGLVLGPGACRVPRQGIRLGGGWTKLDLGAWLSHLPSARAGGRPICIGPVAVNLYFGGVDGFGRHFTRLGIRGKIGAKNALLKFTGPDLDGTVTVPSRPSNRNPIVASIQSLRIPPRARPVIPTPGAAMVPKAVSSPVSGTVRALPFHPLPAAANASATRLRPARGGLSPLSIPPFDLRIKRLILAHGTLDNIFLRARRVSRGVLFRPVRIGGGLLSLNGSAVWLAPPLGPPEGAVNLTADIHHLGYLLESVGPGPVITGHGAISTAIAWHANIRSDEFWRSLVGEVSTDLRNGSITQVRPGVGRVLSLLNLVNLPRYLTLNFHNIFNKGFPYSRIYGNYTLSRGQATTRGMIIDSSIAWIKLTGSIDLVNQIMHQQAAIVPDYTGSLPVVAAIFGGLGVGAAIYALTKMLGNPIARATMMHYTIQGPIAKPVVRPRGATPPPGVRTVGTPLPGSGGGAGR